MPTTDLMSALIIDSVTFIPQWRQELARMASGDTRVADLGPELWSAKIGASIMGNDDAVAAAAIINALRGSLNTFYVWDHRRQYPRKDPDGSILGASTVTLAGISTGLDAIEIAGLPAGYVISPGDKISWDYGSPARRAFHEFSASATADGSGNLASTAIVPRILSGTSGDLTVTLKQPAAEMMITPGSYDFPSTGPVTSSIQFTAIQVR